MKKIIFALLALAMPLLATAQNYNTSLRQATGKHGFYPLQDDAEYLQNKVPMVDGKVVFQQTVSVPGKTKDQIFAAAANWANLRFTANSGRGSWERPGFYSNSEYAKLKSADKASGTIECQGSEEMVFRSAFAVKDYCQANYILDIKVNDGSLTVTMRNIIYIYLGADSERMAAEEYIVDKECFNKKGLLCKPYAKFRVKTIDLQYELFKELAEAVK